jgi:hypothetical protein
MLDGGQRGQTVAVLTLRTAKSAGATKQEQSCPTLSNRKDSKDGDVESPLYEARNRSQSGA